MVVLEKSGSNRHLRGFIMLNIQLTAVKQRREATLREKRAQMKGGEREGRRDPLVVRLHLHVNKSLL